jgi:hypothetical protein
MVRCHNYVVFAYGHYEAKKSLQGSLTYLEAATCHNAKETTTYAVVAYQDRGINVLLLVLPSLDCNAQFNGPAGVEVSR